MKRTERLYGVPPSKYAHLQIPLCRMKIADGRAKLAELKPKLNLIYPTKEEKEIAILIEEIKESITWNQELIYEALGKI